MHTFWTPPFTITSNSDCRFGVCLHGKIGCLRRSRKNIIMLPVSVDSCLRSARLDVKAAFAEWLILFLLLSIWTRYLFSFNFTTQTSWLILLTVSIHQWKSKHVVCIERYLNNVGTHYIWWYFYSMVLSGVKTPPCSKVLSCLNRSHK